MTPSPPKRFVWRENAAEAHTLPCLRQPQIVRAVETQMLTTMVGACCGLAETFPKDKAHPECASCLLATKLVLAGENIYYTCEMHASLSSQSETKIIFLKQIGMNT